MRHRKLKGNLSRTLSERKALLKNMAISLFLNSKIETTKAKAKALQSYAEPLITKAKDTKNPLHARRMVFKKLCNKEAVGVLFNSIAPLYRDVTGGYTRVIPLGERKGDGASMVIMELTREVSEPETAGEIKPAKAKASKKASIPEKKVTKEEPKKDTHSAPDVDIADKEEHVVEDRRKEKAKSEDQKIRKQGFFKRFRRKSMD